jgi:hypothetical protein
VIIFVNRERNNGKSGEIPCNHPGTEENFAMTDSTNNATAESIDEREAEIARLAALSPLDYGRQREAVAHYASRKASFPTQKREDTMTNKCSECEGLSYTIAAGVGKQVSSKMTEGW